MLSSLTPTERLVLVELFTKIQTNAGRALGTNAMAGHTWGQMSSLTYKELRVPTELLQDRDERGRPIPSIAVTNAPISRASWARQRCDQS